MFTVSDDVFLLQFLRVRKYRIDEAFQTFERMHMAKKRCAQFFKQDIEASMKMFDSGYCYPLSERDEEGRRVVLVQTRKWNPDVFSVYDATALICYITFILLEEEETQIAGITYVFDHKEITLRHAISPLDARDLMYFVKNCAACRQKGYYTVNLAPFANFIVELFRSFLSEKLKKRFFVLKTFEELKDHINPALLPMHYGGTRSEIDMKQDFLKLHDKHQENVRKFLELKIDWSKVPHDKIWSNSEESNVGSFRKLDID